MCSGEHVLGMVSRFRNFQLYEKEAPADRPGLLAVVRLMTQTFVYAVFI